MIETHLTVNLRARVTPWSFSAMKIANQDQNRLRWPNVLQFFRGLEALSGKSRFKRLGEVLNLLGNLEEVHPFEV